MCPTLFSQTTVRNKTVYYKMFYSNLFVKLKAAMLEMVRWLLRVRRETTQENDS